MHSSFASQHPYWPPSLTPRLLNYFEKASSSIHNIIQLQSQLTYLKPPAYSHLNGFLSPKSHFSLHPQQNPLIMSPKSMTPESKISYNPLYLTSVAIRPAYSIRIPNDSHSVAFISQPALYQEKPKLEEKKSSELRNWLTSFGAGFCAGTIARTSTAPLDRLKFIYQLYYKGSDKPPSLLRGFQELYRRDGLRGLFRGNLVCVLKASPETAIRLTIFEKLKSLIKDEKTGNLNKKKMFFAGGLSGAVANFIIFPMDVLRTRLAATPPGVYKGITDAVAKISKTEGRIRPFYRGIKAGMMANFPTSGLNLMLYESLKELVYSHDQQHQAPALVFMVLAGISALVTCSVMYPMQVITSRQIMQSVLDKENSRRGVTQEIKRTWSSEGIRGFYKGYCPATSKVVLGNAFSFGSYELMKRIFGVEFKKH